MIKLNTRNLAIVGILGVLLIGTVGITSAQQALPKGGDSFETAVKLEPGSYQGSSLNSKEIEHFYITGIKLGQEIKIEGTFIAASANAGAEAVLVLYDKDGTELAEEIDVTYEKPVSMTISYLHRGKESDKYYIKAGSGLFKIASFSLDVSLTEAPVEEVKKGVPTGAEEEAEGVPTKGPNWVLIIGIIVLIVIAGIVIYFLLKKKK